MIRWHPEAAPSTWDNPAIAWQNALRKLLWNLVLQTTQGKCTIVHQKCENDFPSIFENASANFEISPLKSSIYSEILFAELLTLFNAAIIMWRGICLGVLKEPGIQPLCCSGEVLPVKKNGTFAQFWDAQDGRDIWCCYHDPFIETVE